MLPALLKTVKDKGYIIFDDRWQLNIIGIRSAETDQSADQYNDQIAVIFRDHFLNWVQLVFPASTDPGKYWLREGHSAGTAIMYPGQYVDAYAIDLHRGQYSALCQRGPNAAAVKYWRDSNKDEILDMTGEIHSGTPIGLNLHKSGKYSQNIGRYSAGCQIWQSELHFKLVMQLAGIHKALHGNAFTYTLINEEDTK